MSRILAIILFSCSILAPLQSNAEPNSTVTYLMTDPMTMFDYGLYKLHKKVFPFKFKNMNLVYGNGQRNVSYDWDKNRIYIDYIAYQKHSSIKYISHEKLSRMLIKEVRDSFFLNIESFKIPMDFFFSHTNFTRTKQPKDLSEQLENITMFRVTLYVSEKKDDTPPFKPIIQASCYYNESTPSIKKLNTN